MDASLYLQRLKEEITNLREERDLLQSIRDLEVVEEFHERGHPYSFTIDEED